MSANLRPADAAAASDEARPRSATLRALAALDGALHMRYGAGTAIRFEGSAIGTLCVFNPVPHRGSPASLRALEDLAAVATAMLRARIEAYQLYCDSR